MTLSKETIVKVLAENPLAVARALVLLNERQTQDEQATENTRHRNGRGFKPCHAYMGTRMAKYFLARNRLTEKQVAYWRKTDRNGVMRIACYWKQLMEEAEKKALAKQAA